MTRSTCPSDDAPLLRLEDIVAAGPDPMIGRTLEGRYTILAKLGAGSMGTVYRARQHAMGRDVAIKILRSDRALDESSKARFLREARANSLLASPHTVTVFDFGQSESGELYLAMELLDGESLGQRLAYRQRLGFDEAIDAARQALRSMAEAHAKGIIHRDLKPDNLFFARVLKGNETEEIVKVLDFGIAKMMRDQDGLPLNAVETQAGTVFGTPRYMSPEQAQGKPLDARSDLYSLGVILYQMIAGRPPFTDNDAVVVMARHIKTPPKPFSEVCPDVAVPEEVEAAIFRVLAKEPAKRPATADAMSQDLARALDNAAAGTSGVRVSTAQLREAASVDAVAGAGPSPAAQEVETPAGLGLPRRPGRAFTVAAVLALVGITVLFGIRSFWNPAADSLAQPTSSTSLAAARLELETARPTATAPSAAEAKLGEDGAGGPASSSTNPKAEPPTVTPDSLPRAGRSKPAPKPTGAHSAHGPARRAPAPSAAASSSRYGLFE